MKHLYSLTKEQQQIFDLVNVEGSAAASIDAMISFPGIIEYPGLQNAVRRLI